MEAIILKAKAKKLRTEGEELCVENVALISQIGELEKQLRSEQEKVLRLEKEISPLRRLRDLVKELLQGLIESCLMQKFEGGLKSILCEVGKLVGITFAQGKEEAAPEKEQER
jgi:predicted nuclease with TOPRIM domain